jgi:hypothetical protein
MVAVDPGQELANNREHHASALFHEFSNSCDEQMNTTMGQNETEEADDRRVGGHAEPDS